MVDSQNDAVQPEEPAFYDSNADDEDIAWQNQRRPNRRLRSDAILSCPCCMTRLCVDCQRHEFYPNQYRAMFTYNCDITQDQYAPVIAEETATKRNADGARLESLTKDSNEKALLVKCTICKTNVAAFDKSSQVYHFFHVLVGYF
ncbi:hypothetical protein ACOME3_001886 [Neoechinorhynchus agilis]